MALIKKTKWIKDTKIARRMNSGKIVDSKDGELEIEYMVEITPFEDATRQMVANMVTQYAGVVERQLLVSPKAYKELEGLIVNDKFQGVKILTSNYVPEDSVLMMKKEK